MDFQPESPSALPLPAFPLHFRALLQVAERAYGYAATLL
jgi:hypothetical protein